MLSSEQWVQYFAEFSLKDKILIYYFPAVVGVPKSLLKRYEDSTGIVQTFRSPTTKAADLEAV